MKLFGSMPVVRGSHPTMMIIMMLPSMHRMMSSTGVEGGGGATREELREVAGWALRLKVDDLPRDQFSAAFSRSSGPGGQNVNKGTH